MSQQVGFRYSATCSSVLPNSLNKTALLAGIANHRKLVFQTDAWSVGPSFGRLPVRPSGISASGLTLEIFA